MQQSVSFNSVRPVISKKISKYHVSQYISFEAQFLTLRIQPRLIQCIKACRPCHHYGDPAWLATELGTQLAKSYPLQSHLWRCHSARCWAWSHPLRSALLSWWGLIPCERMMEMALGWVPSIKPSPIPCERHWARCLADVTHAALISRDGVRLSAWPRSVSIVCSLGMGSVSQAPLAGDRAGLSIWLAQPRQHHLQRIGPGSELDWHGPKPWERCFLAHPAEHQAQPWPRQVVLWHMSTPWGPGPQWGHTGASIGRPHISEPKS